MTSDFQAFQQAFARHLRDPRHAPRPAGVPARRMAVYTELLFNNICSFVDTCFPVCRAIPDRAKIILEEIAHTHPVPICQ